VDKREAILQAALDLFAERGFHGTPVPLIADKAKVGAGTIYRHFADKENLVNELYRRWKTRLFESITEGLSEALPVRSLFHEVWVRWIDFAVAHPRAIIFLEAHHHSPYLDAASKAESEKIHNAFLGMMASGCSQQLFKAVPPQLHMSFVSGVISQMVKDAWAGRFDLTPEIIEQGEEMCWQAIRS
jgi:AcrR family transcriptional regulator